MNLGGIYFCARSSTLCPLMSLSVEINRNDAFSPSAEYPLTHLPFAGRINGWWCFSISKGNKEIWSYCCHLASYFVLFFPEGDTAIWKD